MEVDLFVKSEKEEVQKAVIEKLKGHGKWYIETSTIVRGWADANKEQLESYLYDECGFSKEEVTVVNGNMGLNYIR